MTTRHLLVGSVLGALVLAWAAYRWEVAPPPEVRGRRLAARLACAACHDLAGGPGAPNPGSREGRVPGWGGGNAMMYFPNPGDMAGWIRDSAPTRYRDSAAFHAQRGRQLLTMAAYGPRLSPRDLADLVAFVSAVAGVAAPTAGAPAEGYAVAERSGCFHCHGAGGRGGVDNPGSFAGYVAGWWGHGYRALVHDRAELLAWIRDGYTARTHANPLLRRVLDRQQLHMPAYRAHLSEAEIEVLAAYIEWLAESAPTKPPNR
ncbi:MAG: hypothetical protein COW73_03285 [Nitrospirae bacterium CG18_big_fil_WC_8_21_14_2_50_70_55]|nr:c-type cytochrome [Deltaproteobacteria bacterium]NCS73132.1 c-type cytochrome [Deltaproteobacteria bacterium]PIQ06588.1 MAG: hypothetical protein COW73_03285 [Nitrospirae bacterium CG18_big_fil_WC_8_21_14_2_50_70_55]